MYDEEIDTNDAEMDAGRNRLGIRDYADVRASVKAAGPQSWLINGVWIAKTPAVIGAEEKLGKTTLAADLAVSIASGTPWCGSFAVPTPGPVIAFFAEDDAAEMTRRIDAICESRGLEPDDLKLRLSFIPPNLSRQSHIDEMGKMTREFGAVAVVIDPLYLSIGERGDGASLYSMGSVLSPLKDELCTKSSAAVMLVHHWNKGGQGNGPGRLAGTGTTQWARTILSCKNIASNIRQVVEDTEAGEVTTQRRTNTIAIDISGNSVDSQTVIIQREMYATDASDLDSRLVYRCQRVDAGSGRSTLPNVTSAPSTEERAIRALETLPEWSTVRDVTEWDNDHPPVNSRGEKLDSLKINTFSKALVVLEDKGRVESRTEKGQRSKVYRRAPGEAQTADKPEGPTKHAELDDIR